MSSHQGQAGLSFSHDAVHINLDRSPHGQALPKGQLSGRIEQRVEAFAKALFSGQQVNPSEGRAAGHWSLRAAGNRALYPEWIALQANGRDELELAQTHQDRMENFVDAVRNGLYRNPEGEPYTHVLHLGIGGSDLGPRLIDQVFTHLKLAETQQGLRCRFVANIDYHEVQSALAALDPTRTLVLIASKSFSTRETLHNAGHIMRWLDNAGPQYKAAALMAATCKPAKAEQFGISRERIFEFSETVGGRFSLWGPVSLSIRLAHGNSAFNALLNGAALMDRHWLTAPASSNLPTLMALADYGNLQHGVDALMLSPYDSRLGLLVPYLQQLWMESLGKGVDLAGQALADSACPTLWGDVGTNSQHAFFQMLHQGRNACAVEILGVIKPSHSDLHSHRLLLSNALAQAEAFASGRLNSSTELADPAVNFRSCPGGRPVQFMLLDTLTPNTLGQLLALWEHRTCALAALQNINPFDQWGVELGKVIAEQIEKNLTPGHNAAENPVTAHLIDRFLSQP